MRRLLILAVAMCGSAQANGPIQWYATVDEASAQAIPANRPVMIEFWAEWCSPCKVMEKEVFSTPEFREVTARFLPVKIDVDKNTAVARKYNVGTLPTIVFADSYGNELFRNDGYVGAKFLLELVRALPGDVTEFNRLNRILGEDKRNFAALEAMGKNLKAAGLFRASNTYYSRALQQKEAKLDSERRAAILTDVGLNLLELQEFAAAGILFHKCLKEFQASVHRPAWLLDLGRVYVFLEKSEKAQTTLEELVGDYPGSPESQRAKLYLEGADLRRRGH